MGSVGLGVQGQHAVAVEVEELAGMGVEEAAGYHGLGRVGVALGVEPVGAAEVGDAAFRGYAGTAEEHHAARCALVNPLAQLFNVALGLVADHGSSFPHPVVRGLEAFQELYPTLGLDEIEVGVGEDVPNKEKPRVYSFGLVTIGENSVIPADVRIGINTAIVGETTPEDYPDGELASGETLNKEGETA